MGCLKIPYQEKNYESCLRVAHKNFENSPGKRSKYYPFGLTMAGISSKAAGSLQNKIKFGGKELQSNEFSDNSGLELYDFHARMYDQQTGHFSNPDPLADQFSSWSPYVYSYNNPIRFGDPTGMSSFDWVETKDGRMIWDDRVTSDNGLTQILYGSDAKYRAPGYSYSSGNSRVSLGDNRQFTVDGVSKTAENSTPGLTINLLQPTDQPAEGGFTFKPEFTANITAAAGAAIDLPIGTGGGGGTGVVGIGLKDNQFFLAGHPITSAGFGPEIQRTWSDVHTPAWGKSSESLIGRSGGKIVSNIQKTSISISPWFTFEKSKNVLTGQVNSQISAGMNWSNGIGLIADFGWKLTFWERKL